MRIAFNCFIPVLQDPVDDKNLNTNAGKVCTSIISNGYYGYHPIINRANTQENVERMEVQNQYDGIQFNNMIKIESMEDDNRNIREKINRKRAWEYGNEEREKKKRRENGKFKLTFRRNSLK